MSTEDHPAPDQEPPPMLLRELNSSELVAPTLALLLKDRLPGLKPSLSRCKLFALADLGASSAELPAAVALTTCADNGHVELSIVSINPSLSESVTLRRLITVLADTLRQGGCETLSMPVPDDAVQRSRLLEAGFEQRSDGSDVRLELTL
jgi:hypothetical protein